MNSIEEIAGDIVEKDDFLIVGHSIPDGDCIGSIIGLYLGMAALGKRVRILLQDPVPSIYLYLPGADQVLKPSQVICAEPNLIYLDCSDPERVGDRSAAILEGPRHVINNDHHKSNTMFGQLNYVDHQAASTAELVYALLENLQVNIDAAIANALYVGIFQDTGGFQHNNTKPDTFRTAAALLDKGVDLDEVKHNLFESKSKEELLLLSLALGSINTSCDGRIAWMLLNYQDVEAIGALEICPEGIINHILTIKGTQIGLLFRELSPGTIKVGFRSKGEIDVSALAARFGGGGHSRAAGATLTGAMEDIEREVILVAESVVS